MMGGFVQVNHFAFQEKDCRVTGVYAFLEKRVRYHNGLDLQGPYGSVVGRLEVGELWTSLGDIAKNNRLSVATVRKVLAKLVALRLIKKVRVTAVGTVYRLTRFFNAVVSKLPISNSKPVVKRDTHTKKETEVKNHVSPPSSERSGPPVMTPEETKRYLAEQDAIKPSIGDVARKFLRSLREQE